MVTKMLTATAITPSLRAITEQFDDDQRPSESYASAESSVWQRNDQPDNDADCVGETVENLGTWEFDNDDQASVADDSTYDNGGVFPSQQDVPDLPSDHFCYHNLDEEDGFEDVDQYLLLSLGFPTKQNAWAGPNHWKYRKVPDSAAPFKENMPPGEKKTKRKKAEKDIDFSNSVNNDYSHLFLPPKNPKSLLLPSNRAPGNTKLPEDCHYQPEDLMKLFLLPHVLCIGNKRRKRNDGQSHPNDGFGDNVPWDDEDNGAVDDEQAYYDGEEDTSMLVKQPRQTNKIEVQYDKAAKVVDVHSLKETIWERMIHSSNIPAEETCQNEGAEVGISFKQVLASFPDSCNAAASLRDISPHLCFICLLHLANEHGLRILGCPSLEELTIHLKPRK